MKKSLGAKTILYPTPILVVGTYDSDGKPNVMTAAWGGISCSVPPCVAVSLRQATYTYGCLMEQRAFTIGLPSADYIKEADFFGMVSGRDVDKFAATGLTPVKSDLVNAPYIEEFPLVIECKLVHTFKLGLHTQFIGEILDVKVDEAVLGEDKLPALDKLKPIFFAPENRAYHGIGGYLGKAFSLGREIQER